ncbi:hypothetical protein AAG570_004982 [Ranatra chinensis]|uniref:ZP domain-containing protein n=1 Tax=Ranatra chinensis TaxID=642074 RepID=A0ABD0YMP9_9HEMI
MSVRLDSAKFTGRMYVQGHADECGVQGTGASSTLLRIVLPSGGLNPCNVHTAVAIGNVNRTLISTVLVVQYHQLIQTVNDRVVRASCLLTETSSPTPTAGSNVTLNATFSVNDSGIQSEVNGSGGSTGLPTNINATARIMLLDARTGKPAGDINLGDPLQLRIEIDPPINVSMVIVGHLIASSGSGEDSSILLLDGRGCPRDVFPPLTPLDQQTLVANFKAFRFPSSPMMTFSAVVTLCSQVCQPTDCGNNVVSYGKRRRKRDETSSAVAGRTYLEMPLHLTFVVNTPANSSLNSSHVGSDGGIEGVCLTFLTVALLSLFWLLVQCALVALCCGVMARQRRRFEEARADTVSLKHDFNVAPPTSTLPRPHQRVTWDPDIE